MRKIGIMMSVLALCGGTAFSQSQLDAFRYSQTELSGTARYLGMGGAFGALGGDISAMNTNPAGLAVYHSSEIVTTFSLSAVNAKSDWLGNKVDEGKNTFSFDNIAYVGYFPTGNDEGLVSWNVGFSYNRVKNYRRNYTLNTAGNLHTSLSDYTALRSYGLPAADLASSDGYNPYENPNIGDWLSILSFQGGYTVPANNEGNVYSSAFYDPATQEFLNLEGAELRVSEWGSIDKYNMAFGLNISEMFMFGADVSITDLKYEYESRYDEGFTRNSNLYLDNYLKTDGTGYSFNIGAIVRPVDFLRLGVAYNSPVWYKMTDYYQGHAGTDIPFLDDPKLDASTPKGVYDYEYRSPDKWLFSAAAIFGTVGLISVDYELTNYKNMRMYQTDGSSNLVTNEDISNNFKMGNTIRVGAEFKPTPQFAVRAGVAYSDSPLKDPIKNGDIEIATVGTIPHFTIYKGTTSYTVGLGYRFTPNFYTDLACVIGSYKEDAYIFSNMIEDGEKLMEAQPATLKNNTTRVALTLGYKF
ncbi:outer membrane protein transport protein [uncultured Parabacteroides sp.]|uniref:OmpP1/FadL family transporter n=1 Tax=uncultured Parabacteroides sp. TaxID=512312 RepID=UPI0026235AEB|nr:outer membrane protein transport protein [uncultured Parabacteroides sp.]